MTIFSIGIAEAGWLDEESAPRGRRRPRHTSDDWQWLRSNT